uniref:Uncharacterized protein n=1 Tax=Caenorhabditis tropicalis TaxID=1561998 RepID=A0A1I7V0R4_9PELO
MVQCGNEFIHSLFSTDGSRKPTSGSSTGAHDGNANIGGIGSVDTRGDQTTVIEKPDEPVPWGSNSGDAAPPTSTLPTVTSGFPTLIPFSPDSWSTVTQSPLAPLPMVTSRIPIPESSSSSPIPLTPRRDAHRRRTTPDPRIIRPPESLVVIGDYDEDEPPSETLSLTHPVCCVLFFHLVANRVI